MRKRDTRGREVDRGSDEGVSTRKRENEREGSIEKVREPNKEREREGVRERVFKPDGGNRCDKPRGLNYLNERGLPYRITVSTYHMMGL